MTTFAVVTGGGTAGHVLPALAVAEALVAAGHQPDEIHYVGAKRGIETTLLPTTSFPHTFIDVVGFQRSLSRRNLGFVPKMITARRSALALLRTLQPNVVVSVGGYASMPAVFAARKLGIPVVVVSYDMLPGRASRLAARKAAACCVAFPDSDLPRAALTGAPIRQAILDVDRLRDRSDARRALGIADDRFFIAIMGGSQGSGVLNGALSDLYVDQRDDAGLAIRHVMGKRFVSDAPAAIDGSDGLLYQPVGYESDMPTVYAAADLLIGRGGASTAHEVAVTGIPAILVPWAGSADGHQLLNVRWLADQGAAICLEEANIADLPAVIDRLRTSDDERRSLGLRAHSVGDVHRQGAMANVIESVALA